MTATVRDLGEDGILALLRPLLPPGPLTRVPSGDDCAVYAPSGRVVCTTDVLVEGQHFRRSWSSAREVGERAAAQNLADVVAMGARPFSLVVGLALPPDTPGEWVRDLAAGLSERAGVIGAGIDGGDLTQTEGPLVIAVTALGDLAGAQPLRRSGAKVGDAVVVAGTLGRSRTGLDLLHRGTQAAACACEGEVGELAASCVAAFRAPCPPLEVALAGAGSLTALMDVSDSLVRDGTRLARASGVTLNLDLAALEPDIRALAALDAWAGEPADVRVLTGGEDHAFLGTCAPAAVPAGFRRIGTVRAAQAAPLTLDGVPYTGALGWESLA